MMFINRSKPTSSRMLHIFTVAILLVLNSVPAQDMPASYSNLGYDEQGRLYLQVSDTLRLYADTSRAWLTLNNLKGHPQGTDRGIAFDFNKDDFRGKLYYGFIPYNDAKFPQPVFFKRAAKIEKGRAEIIILKKMSGKYDMIGWEKSGRGTLGYRVVDSKGNFLYDGVVSFKGTGPFEIDDSIIEGPFVNLLTPQGATISFETNRSVKASIEIDGKIFGEAKATRHHEIEIKGLKPATSYKYTVKYGIHSQSYSFRTAPLPGSRQPFVFAYASDSRAGQGGGERNLFGANAYIIKKIMALAAQQNIAFFQFTGDLINGYLSDPRMMDLQYANWKRAVSPFAAYFQIIAGMGNHEALVYSFPGLGRYGLSIDKFPFDTHSAEAVFAKHFVNPLNGPESEDGSAYDPNPRTTDFPSYKENTFYYTYDNVAVIVLNSDYWYAPSLKYHPVSSGNLHGYIMDKQLEWLNHTLNRLESDKNIDHVFITLHTPFFPNGGHSGDDMWYSGDNSNRAYVAGQPVLQGIIERRDQLLDLLVNRSQKVAAILTGDEHNYNRLKISSETPIYPEKYDKKKLTLRRTIWQINNGSAGAPYYAQEKLPWSAFVEGFTTQTAVVFFKVEGRRIEVQVLNPDTLEPVDNFILRE